MGVELLSSFSLPYNTGMRWFNVMPIMFLLSQTRFLRIDFPKNNFFTGITFLNVFIYNVHKFLLLCVLYVVLFFICLYIFLLL